MKINNLPILVEKIWGGRSLSRLFNIKLPKGKRIGECWAFYNKKYPVVLKLLDVKKPLSVQVHPFGKKGKSELWYVIEAGKSAKVLGGIALDEYRVKSGDWVYLSGGAIHTILPPAVLFEVSQENLITYRLYDWGRGSRPLDIENGIRNIKIGAKPKFYRNIDHFKCPHFKVRLKRLKKGDEFMAKCVCFVLEGSIEIAGKIINKGEADLISGTAHSLSQTEVFLVNT